MSRVLVWLIVTGSIAGILLRPKDWPEAVWACAGAFLLVISGLLPVSQAGIAIVKGTDVYLFLAGMMLLAELARREGLFDWLASVAVSVANGSRSRLFALVYIVGIVVTVFLSNDATAVVLTPAVYASVQKAGTKALPYLLICAFIANAASFVLPISNPANLVVYGKSLPPLIPWLRTFLLPSVFSITATYIALRWISRKDLAGRFEGPCETATLSYEGRLAAGAIIATGALLLVASGLGFNLGWLTCVLAAVAILVATRASASAVVEIAKKVSWSVLPLVAGLFVLVESLNRIGALRDVAGILYQCAGMHRYVGSLTASFAIAALSNVMNNLPSGLLAGGALQTIPAPLHLRNAVLIGVDLGPNLSVTGSLATVLWLIALRREGEQISGWQFFKAGLVVMPPALFLATLAATMLSK